MAYHRYHGVDTIVRIFNTYGPRMRLRDGRVVPAFIGQALAGTPLTIFGDGAQTRSFCYVSDLIDGIFRLSQSDFNEPVNIGNPREMTIKHLPRKSFASPGRNKKSITSPCRWTIRRCASPISGARRRSSAGNRSGIRGRDHPRDRILPGMAGTRRAAVTRFFGQDSWIFDEVKSPPTCPRQASRNPPNR